MKAYDFSLPADNGENVSLSDYKGKKVVLYFYPKDSTPGCTQEACSFRDNFARLTAKGVVVLGISKDSIKRHENFKKKNELPFLLLSDEKGEIVKEWRKVKVKGHVDEVLEEIEKM